MNIDHTLTDDAFERLRGSLPEVSSFRKLVGVKRGYEQASHDRYILHYRPGIDLAEPWKDFVAELQGEFLPELSPPHAGRWAE